MEIEDFIGSTLRRFFVLITRNTMHLSPIDLVTHNLKQSSKQEREPCDECKKEEPIATFESGQIEDLTKVPAFQIDIPFNMEIIGRGKPIHEILKLIENQTIQLITVSADAGTGKTTVALGVAKHLSDLQTKLFPTYSI